jgi:tRNA A37 methylthiotransferase MiaB
MKNIKTTATATVLGCMANNNPSKKETDPDFVLLIEDTEKLNFDGEIIEQTVQRKIKSLIKLEKGEHEVEISIFKPEPWSKPIYKVLGLVKRDDFDKVSEKRAK